MNSVDHIAVTHKIGKTNQDVGKIWIGTFLIKGVMSDSKSYPQKIIKWLKMSKRQYIYRRVNQDNKNFNDYERSE